MLGAALILAAALLPSTGMAGPKAVEGPYAVAVAAVESSISALESQMDTLADLKCLSRSARTRLGALKTTVAWTRGKEALVRARYLSNLKREAAGGDVCSKGFAALTEQIDGQIESTQKAITETNALREVAGGTAKKEFIDPDFVIEASQPGECTRTAWQTYGKVEAELAALGSSLVNLKVQLESAETGLRSYREEIVLAASGCGTQADGPRAVKGNAAAGSVSGSGLPASEKGRPSGISGLEEDRLKREAAR